MNEETKKLKEIRDYAHNIWRMREEFAEDEQAKADSAYAEYNAADKAFWEAFEAEDK